MSRADYDLLVIGGGSGGVRAARVAAGHGARVAIAEEYRFGGTCVIRGCVPKKLLVYASRFRDDFDDAAGFGWSLGEARFDWPTLIAAKDKEIARLEGQYRGGLEAAGVTVIDSRAHMESAEQVRIEADGRRVTARTVLVATGARPFVPSIPGARLAITSNEAFDLAKLPASIAIVGGGYVAVEFAGIFHGLGVPVTLLYRGEQILRGFDDDLRDGLAEALRRRGIEIRTGAVVESIGESHGDYVVGLAGGGSLRAGRVMFATGRVPNTAGLGLERAGVAVGKCGEVIVDAFSRSSVSNIYAVGDVTDRVNLTPVAIREGLAFADTVFGGRPTNVNHEQVPSAVFSTPEIATVGLTEQAARDRHQAVDIYKARFRPMRNTLAGRDERTLMKLVVEAATDTVLGCHILGPDAAEIVQMAAIALGMGATKADFDAAMALHPSAAEELVTMRQKWAPPKASGT